jgi:hypothetical protein
MHVKPIKTNETYQVTMQSNTKTVIVALAVLFTISLSASQLEFRTESPIEFRSSLDLNNNTISDLPDPQTADQAVPESYISTNYLSRTDPTVQGNLALSDNGNIELRNGYISNDGDDEGLRVLDSGEVRIENGILDLSGNSLTGLPDSDDSNDAVRQGQLSNYVKLNSDTLEGNLSFDNQYYVTDLPEPENPEDAATKSFVESYADNNEQVISDDQKLGIDSSSTDDIITLENGSQVTIDDDNTQLDDTGASSNIDMNGYDITSTGGEFCVGQYC